MSFASILGPSNNEPSPPKQPEPKLAKTFSSPSKPAPAAPADQDAISLKPKVELINGINGVKEFRTNDGIPKEPLKPVHPPKPRKVLSKSEAERITTAMLKLDDTVFSDPETGDFDQQHQRYRERSRKRARQLEDVEGRKRKAS